LGWNDLSGVLPPELGKCANLRILNLSGQNFTGSVPTSYTSLSNLRELSLDGNAINGSIPADFVKLSLLTTLALSNNRLSGEIPANVGNATNLQILELYGNELYGTLPPSLENCTNLQTLDLHNNRLTGEIPRGVALLPRLEQLNLQGNAISGPILPELGNLSTLVALNLSRNNLTGTIPTTLQNLPNLVLLDVSWNDLYGEIPSVLGAKFSKLSFEGNSGLCGPPLNSNCGGPRKSWWERFWTWRAIVGVAVGGGVLVLVLLALCGFCCVHLLRKHRAGELGNAPGSPLDKVIMFRSPITLANIQEATGQFDEDHVLSRTRHGIVFKAILQVHIPLLEEGPSAVVYSHKFAMSLHS